MWVVIPDDVNTYPTNPTSHFLKMCGNHKPQIAECARVVR
jgi:hypothetical protein